MSPTTTAARKTPRIAFARLRRPPAAAIVAALALCALTLLSACSDNAKSNPGGDSAQLIGPTIVRPAPEGEPRHLRLGFSTLPPERTNDAYINTFATAAQYADTILIQRVPPWEDFLPGATVSSQTNELTRLETALLHQYSDLHLFFAIDPTDGVLQRSRIANLPANVDPGAGFADPALREAFVAYTTYIAANYEPAYLALGVEINMLYERNPEQFQAFVSLYDEAYTAAKEASPNTRVFPTFQLEDLEGTFGTIHPPHWEVLDFFKDHMDALGISTYPFLADVRSTADIRPDYYSQLRDHFEGDILISETGYASSPVEGKVNVGTEQDQQAFLERILTDAERNDFTAVIWLAALDPAFVAEGATSVFRDIGLRKSDGGNKLAWSSWEQWARRPQQ
ncbi:MAG TPA: hypothetical protein VFY90_09470 [Tepidiformaceae bacterium]|nr:hypothetical protein [Tepidiformaceae bacterium]